MVRSGRTGRVLGHRVMVPSTLGTFLRAFSAIRDSQSFRRLPFLVPSQTQSFRLVERVVERGAVIVVMRSRALWLGAVPKLRTAPVIELKVPRSAYITPGNLPARRLRTDLHSAWDRSRSRFVISALMMKRGGASRRWLRSERDRFRHELVPEPTIGMALCAHRPSVAFGTCCTDDHDRSLRATQPER